MAAQTIGEKQDGHSNNNEGEDEEKQQKWVINTTDIPLTEAQESLLAHGPNYAVVPKHPPTIEIITAIERTCQNMAKGEEEELRGEVKAILRKTKNNPPKSTSHWKSRRPLMS